MSTSTARAFGRSARCTSMNRIQAVAKGTFQPDGTLVYEMYELR